MKLKIQSHLVLLLAILSIDLQAANLPTTYDITTEVLTIPKLGVPAGDTGYAYQVEMKLFSIDPIGFVVSNLNLLGSITADEALSALYKSENHSIYFPSVVVINADDSQLTLTGVTLSLGADPFVWFYIPELNIK